MPQLLIELLSEEIPARMQLQAARDFERLMGAKLTAAGLTFDAALSYVGPRRLVLRVEGLPAETAAVREEVKGPREGAPPQALEGFLRKVGLTQDALTIENGVYMARIEKPGAYVLQAGSYRNEGDADRVARQLTLQNIDAKVQRVALDTDVWFRVRVGPISDLPQLNKVRRQLQSADVDALVIRVGD